MADAHDKLCEEADVGSLCDCSCAGSKHAIRHTKGGVPGAGAVSKAAQAAAHKDGRAAVINNRAVPKEGSKVSSSAPKSFRDAKPEPGKPEPGKPAGKPISMMSNLSGHTDEELKAAHAAIEAKIGPQGGISGPQRDIQQKIERELALRGRPLPGNRPDTRGNPVFGKSDPAAAKELKGSGAGNELDRRAAARNAAALPSGTEVTRANTTEGDRVTHVREGKGTVENAPKFGAWRVKFDSGKTVPVLPHEMVKGEHTVSPNADTGKPITREDAARQMFGDKAAKAKIDAAKGKGGSDNAARDIAAAKSMMVTSRRRNGAAKTEILNDQGKPAKTYDRLPGGQVMNRNPWHPPDLDQSQLSTQRQPGGKIAVTYQGKPLGSYTETGDGQYVAETGGKPLLRHGRPEHFGNAQQAFQAVHRATADYQPGELLTAEQSLGPAQYGEFVRRNPDNTFTLKQPGATGKEFDVPAQSVIGRDNRKPGTPDKTERVRSNGDKPRSTAPQDQPGYVPPHVQEAIDHLEGRKGGVSSYVYGALNHNSLSKLTPEQRTKMRGQLEKIQSSMSPEATDKPRVDKALASLRAIDAPTGRAKKAKALPERQAKALDAVAKAGSSDRNANSLIDINKYAGENHVVASALAKKGLLRQGGTNARLVQLTEAGHEQVALARGDQKHLALTQHVAALAAQADQLEKRSHDLSVSQNERFTAGQQMGNVVARMRELQDQRRRYLNGDSSQGVETRR